ncbi:hypothetical protein PoB_000397200 [Plakobranchus ocellatus]|uniref:Uncharacterized protein n=1 Tax=Plakobranchus ocellatus TaxID=259542 RepID=A0AAV3Y5P8_9GAST|nr:hypothetical protein PoB_000397200 [Plakobranchus ocellatus]
MGESVTDPRPVVVDVPTVAEPLHCEQRKERDQIALYCNKFESKDACKSLPLNKRISCTTGYIACIKNYCGIWCLNTEVSKLDFLAVNSVGYDKNNGLRLSVPNLALTTLFTFVLLII